MFLAWPLCSISTVAGCLNPGLTTKKLKILGFFHFKTKSPDFKCSQSAKLQSDKQKFAWTLALRISLAEWSCLALESGWQTHLQPVLLPFGPQKASFTEGSVSFGHAYRPFYAELKHYSNSYRRNWPAPGTRQFFIDNISNLFYKNFMKAQKVQVLTFRKLQY